MPAKAVNPADWIGKEWDYPTKVVTCDTFTKDGEPATWTVRAPTGNELAIANRAKESRKREEAVAEALSGTDKARIVKEMRIALGKDASEIEPDTSWRMALLRCCSVEPECDDDLARHTVAYHAYDFQKITNAILELMLSGPAVKKTLTTTGDETTSAQH